MLRPAPLLAAAFAAALVGAAPAARAADYAFQVTASGFADQDPILFGGAAHPMPTDPVSLDFALAFDPAAGDQFDRLSGIAETGGSLSLTSPLAFDYDTADNALIVGGSDGLGLGLTEGTDDFVIEINDPFGVPSLASVTYTSSATPGIFLSTTGDVSVTKGVANAAVPAPGGAWVAAVGLLGLLAARRRR